MWLHRSSRYWREFLILLHILCVLPGPNIYAWARNCKLRYEKDENESSNWKWGLSYGNLCKCTSVRFAGAYQCASAGPTIYAKKPLVSTDVARIREHYGIQCEDNCQQRLGMEDRTIADSQINASSEWSENHGINNARLNRPAQNGTTGAWSARFSDLNQWVQVHLITPTLVTGVMIQGREDAPQWVTLYKVEYSSDGHAWMYIQNNNQEAMVFEGNINQTTIVTGVFPSRVSAKFIRIRPTAWHKVISLRFELTGCPAACNFKVGWPIKARKHTDKATRLVTVATMQQYFCSGEVSIWRYQATTSEPFCAIVFRPVDGARTKFKVVGINDIPAGKINEPVEYSVPKGDRVKVQRGDVIGWSFEVGTLTFDNDADGADLVRWTWEYQYSINDTITFDLHGSREYSLEAIVHINMDTETSG